VEKYIAIVSVLGHTGNKT